MGVLDIRMRSVQRGNIGNVQPVHVPDFMSVAQMRIRNNEAVFQNINNGLQAAARGGEDLYSGIRQREDDRRINDATNAIQERYNAYMYGDGKGGTGAMNTAFTDGGEWMKANDEQYKRIVSEVFGDDKAKGGLSLSSYQQRMVERNLAGYQRGWFNQQAQKANAVYNEREMASAVKGCELADGKLQLEYSPENWDAWAESNERLIKVSQRQGKMMTPEEVSAFKRQRGLAVTQNEMKRRMGEYAADPQVMESEDSTAVGKFYDEKIKEVTENPSSLIPQDERIKDALGADGIGVQKDADGNPTGVYKAFLIDLKEAKQKAMHAAEKRRANKVLEVNNASHTATASIELDKESGSMSAAQVADAYRSHLDAPSGFSDKDGKAMTWRDAYKEYSQVRGKSVQRTIEVYDREAKRVAKGAQAEDSPFAKSDSEDAAWYVEMQKRIINAERDKTDPNKLMEELDANQKRVTSAHYLAMYNELTKKRDAEDIRIRNEVFTEFLNAGVKTDSDKYVGMNTFEKAVDKSARGSKSSGDAVKVLLGSPNAEYRDDSLVFDQPNFKIEDVDSAVEYIGQYLKDHPKDKVGAKKALMEIVEPMSRAARAREFRDRIVQQRKANTYSSLEAFKGMK